MKRYRSFAVAALLVAAVSTAHAGQDKSSHPGYVSSDWSKSLTSKEPSVQVMLDPPLLKLIASASKESDPDLNAVLSQLAFVRVNVVENVTSEPAKVTEAVDSQLTTLAGKGWSTIAKVRDDEQRADVLMKTSDENKIVGFVVIVSGDGELVLVNIAGDIDPDKFGASLGSLVPKVAGGDIKLEGLGDVLGSLKPSNDASTDAEKDTPEKPAAPSDDHKSDK